MTARHHKAFSAIALFLVFSVTQVYVQASLVASTPNNSKGATALVSGKLATRSGGLIKLNGNDVGPGTTILSGAQIQTPAEIGATVQLGKLGKVDLAPETSLTLSFSQSNVDVKLDSGYVVLTTMKGIDGTLTTPNGVVSKSDPAKASTLVGQDDDNKDKNKKKKGGVIPPGGDVTGGGILGAIGTHAAEVFGLIVLGGAITAALIDTQHDRGLNPSPATNR
ncbi:MAG TPA: hypothetical protein VGO91_07280 [Pyrinomonadaceae bacterium]|jgi:hypothetical protein|nr:hypothetical protein [Pyrinomonadaceae bacterium]